MRKLIAITLTIGFFAFTATSCSQYGCPNVAKEFQFDKDLKEGDVLVSITDYQECMY